MGSPQPTDPPRVGKSRTVSAVLWAVGGLLWIGVFAAAAWVWWLRPVRPVQTPGTVVVDVGRGDGGEPAAVAGIIPAGSTVASAWSPAGIDDFTFTERSGEPVSKADLLGEPWVVGFIFTRCAGPCPKVTGQMLKLQESLPDADFRLVTLTVDPDHDTPEKLRQYADFFGADPEKWLFLTGPKEELYRYIGKTFLMPVQEMTGADRLPGFEVLHTTNLLLVDAKGVVRGKYNALVPEEMAKLRRDLKKRAG